VRCLGHAFAALGRPCPPDDALAARIGPPLRDTFAALLHTSDAALIERAVALYRERFGTVGLFENRVYDGVPAMLADAAAVGTLFVATSKATVYARRILDHFGLSPHFRRVYGADLDGRFDDKRELIAHLLAVEGLPPARTVMVGDRGLDVAAARASGVRSVGVLWGFATEGELAAAGPDALCAAPGGLAACLRGLVPPGA
jgi:phosphoglycolate phosphatase